MNDAGQLQISLTAKMEELQAQFIMESFCRILLALLEDPHQPASSVDVIGNNEREFLSNELSNRHRLHVPRPELLQEAFERHAVGTPEAIAIDWNGEATTSYVQLDLLANQLANELVQRQGVSVGDMIPLMLDKSVDMLVAIFGVMKAGAAYVPLSPDNPPDRNAFIIGEVQAKLVITQTDHSTLIPINDGLAHIHMDQLPLTDVSTERPNVSVTPEQPAYVIYTSGSTGMPKGVKVPHRAAAAAVVSMAEIEGRHRGEWRSLQFANYVFDASVQDFFNTLSTGGTLCLAPTDQLQSDLAGRIRAMDVRQAILTPTVAKLLDPRELPSFCTMIVGGEPLTRDVIDKWAQHELLNVYGPTETAMVVTTKAVQDGVRPSNIGTPFPTVMAFILQTDGLDLIPYGGVGELCIAGPQVTDGYLNRDELTAAAFVQNNVLQGSLFPYQFLSRLCLFAFPGFFYFLQSSDC
jgi:amino acid adenylation domain-containing protein